MALALPLSLKALWRNSSSVLLGADRIDTNHVPPCTSMCIHVSYRTSTMILSCSLNVLQPFGSCRFSDLDPVLHSLASYEISPSRSSSSKLKSVYASSTGTFSLGLVVLLHVVHLSLSLWVFLSFYPLCAESLTWHIPWRPGVLKLNQASWISNSKAFNQASTPGSCRRAFIAFNVIMFVTSVTSVTLHAGLKSCLQFFIR